MPPRLPTIPPGADRALGRRPEELALDLLLADGGRRVFMRPLHNYADRNLEACREMLLHPQCRLGLADGGAHCGTNCDASTPTTMLTHWVRDRRRDRLPLEWIVRKMTAETATMYGLGDRGVLAAGMVGDVNVIDEEALALDRPEFVHDLPGGARRFVQRATGYVATVKSGSVILVEGADQGERPGRLLRGAR